MIAAHRDEALKRYRRPWQVAARMLVMVPLIWLLLRYPGRSRFDVVPEYVEFGSLVWAMEGLGVVTPMLAWTVARRRLRQASAHSPAPDAAYRSAPFQPPAWRVSGPFPWWAPGMLGVLGVTALCEWLAMVAFFRTSLFSRVFDMIALCGQWTGTRTACDHAFWMLVVCAPWAIFGGIVWLWVRRWRRDAVRVGVLERVLLEDGSHGLTLHTLHGVEHVTIAWAKPSSRRLRLKGSRQMWHAVEPIDDLVDPDFKEVP